MADPNVSRCIVGEKRYMLIATNPPISPRIHAI